MSVTHAAQDAPKKKERVVILGSGWAGYGLARTLSKEKYEPIVISPRGYFVFTPLLAGTAVGTLEFRVTLEPVRRAGVGFYQGWADDVDFTRKVVRVEANATDDMVGRTVIPLPPPTKGPLHTQEEARPRLKGETFDVPYDKLVIAVGAYSQTFGIQGVREHAHFLRDVGDARRIRLRVLSLFEQCSYPSRSDGDAQESSKHPSPSTATLLSDDDKRALLHFAIVGGGPTGIEYAAELHDLIYDDLRKLYPDLMKFVQITVYDVAPKVLPMFDQALADYAMKTFNRNGIAVKTQHHLEHIRLADGYLGSEHGGLKIKIKEYGDEEVSAGLVVWSTGLMQNPLVKKLEAKPVPPGSESASSPETIHHHLLSDKRTGGIMVDPYLRARTSQSTDAAEGADGGSSILPNVFVIGDCAVIENDGMLPKTAQVASQQAAHLARQLNKGDAAGKPFQFRNWGTLTYLGGWKAIHQSSADQLRGWLAWVLWRGAYLTRSMSWRNKILVPVYWVVTWLFGRGISRF
jgi:NADH dehydrogenase